jgi:hypothetical protein
MASRQALIREIARPDVSNFEVFNHRIGYRSFGNDPDDIARPRTSRTVENDRSAGAAALNRPLTKSSAADSLLWRENQRWRWGDRTLFRMI